MLTCSGALSEILKLYFFINSLIFLSPEVNPILKLFFAKSLIELEITPLEIFSNTEIV